MIEFLLYWYLPGLIGSILLFTVSSIDQKELEIKLSTPFNIMFWSFAGIGTAIIGIFAVVVERVERVERVDINPTLFKKKLK